MTVCFLFCWFTFHPLPARQRFGCWTLHARCSSLENIHAHERVVAGSKCQALIFSLLQNRWGLGSIAVQPRTHVVPFSICPPWYKLNISKQDNDGLRALTTWMDGSMVYLVQEINKVHFIFWQNFPYDCLDCSSLWVISNTAIKPLY